jgi:hypothetical protein
MPLAATGITVLIIVAIGTLLLEVEHFTHNSLVAVAVALALAGAVLVGCALAARGGTSERGAHH